MVRALKAFFPAVLLAYVVASFLATQSNLGNLQMLGMDVGLGDRAGATFHDMIGMASSYLLLILVAFVLGLPVAAGLTRLMPGQRAFLYALAGFTAIVIGIGETLGKRRGWGVYADKRPKNVADQPT